jgi:hypothetical protein
MIMKLLIVLLTIKGLAIAIPSEGPETLSVSDPAPTNTTFVPEPELTTQPIQPATSTSEQPKYKPWCHLQPYWRWICQRRAANRSP